MKSRSAYGIRKSVKKYALNPKSGQKYCQNSSIRFPIHPHYADTSGSMVTWKTKLMVQSNRLSACTICPKFRFFFARKVTSFSLCSYIDCSLQKTAKNSGKGVWFECEQPVCGEERCVTRHRTATSPLTGYLSHRLLLCLDINL